MAPAGGHWVWPAAQAIWQGWPTLGRSRDSRATTGPQAQSRYVHRHSNSTPVRRTDPRLKPWRHIVRLGRHALRLCAC